MIVTNLSDIERYRGLGINLDKAIAWLLAGGWGGLPDGKLEIDGTNVFALVQHYDSKTIENCRFETHRKYVDIQMLVSGTEIMEVRPIDGLVVAESYKPDIELYAAPEAGSVHAVLLAPGTAAILFPEDAHRPCIAIGGIPVAVHKIVLKVAL
jgi:biofilm protein TabA